VPSSRFLKAMGWRYDPALYPVILGGRRCHFCKREIPLADGALTVIDGRDRRRSYDQTCWRKIRTRLHVRLILRGVIVHI
jgi:hypothetical protein